MKMSQAPRGQRQSVLLFGPPKSGKTLMAGRLAASKHIYYVGMENGHSTFEQLPMEWQERIDLILLPDSRSYPIAIETGLKIVKGLPTNVCEKHGKVDCAICKKASDLFQRVAFNELDSDSIVIFDSLTQLTDSAIAHITKAKPDDYKLDYDDWGNLGKLMAIFLSHIQTAAYNVICISHETEVEMEDGKMKLVATSGTRNASRNTAKYFGHVVYCEVGTGKHKFTSSTTAKPGVLIGSRTNVALEKMDVPTLESIFAGQAATLANTDGHEVSGVSATINGATSSASTNQSNGQIAAGGLAALLASRKAASSS